MKIYFKIRFKLGKEYKDVFFGEPETEKELEEMYKFRYKIYTLHNYFGDDVYKDKKDFDDLDRDKKSKYFIAKVDRKILGTARLIKDYYLPTEKECFEFKEPTRVALMPRDRRVEIGRLIVARYGEEKSLPRHIVMLGIIKCIADYAKKQGVEGGYSFIKNSLRKKLALLGFPFYVISEFKQVYNKELLRNYFSDLTNKVWPIYFVADEVWSFSDNFFKKKYIFKKNGGNYVFRNNWFWNILRNVYMLKRYIKDIFKL